MQNVSNQILHRHQGYIIPCKVDQRLNWFGVFKPILSQGPKQRGQILYGGFASLDNRRHFPGLLGQLGFVLDFKRSRKALFMQCLDKRPPIHAVPETKARECRLVVVAIPGTGADWNSGFFRPVFPYPLHGVHIAPKRIRYVPGRLDMDPLQARHIRVSDDFDRVGILPNVVGRVIDFPMVWTGDQLVHDLSGSQYTW